MADAKPSMWHLVIHDGARYRDVGIRADGTLHNPNGYPGGKVRAAIAAAAERKRERRGEGARKAGVTRARRRERKVAEIVALLRSGGRLTPAHTCRLCRKALGDPESIGRGIGSDCWQDILKAIEGDADA